MSRSLRLYFDDILVSCNKILRYSQGLDYKSFMEDELRFDATLRNLQIIGEAVKQVPQEMRAKYPRIEWRKIPGLRDILAHAYFSLEDEIIWDIIQTKIIPLKSEVETIINQEFE
ncbi:HepT-like ribonuclease domain-containing protein [Crocosphaera sp. Alani8]|uniref:HepT-like ribonuclease domain-containing protein n=1 Tax=Crocosphaera sp. Alani8 TaxID=3038952 RepID=UPI00313D564D